jgi:hypothetical protein
LKGVEFSDCEIPSVGFDSVCLRHICHRLLWVGPKSQLIPGLCCVDVFAQPYAVGAVRFPLCAIARCGRYAVAPVFLATGFRGAVCLAVVILLKA